LLFLERFPQWNNLLLIPSTGLSHPVFHITLPVYFDVPSLGDLHKNLTALVTALSVVDDVAIDMAMDFVSNEKKEAIKAFAIKQNLQDKSQVIFLQDSTYTFAKQFEANSIPYILVYDAQGKLLLRHKGQLRAEKLLQLLGEK